METLYGYWGVVFFLMVLGGFTSGIGAVLVIAVLGAIVWAFLNPPPTDASSAPIFPTSRKEVYHVENNQFPYADAKAVCTAFGGELASYDQVEGAYKDGAEWASYGWSKDGLALFPRQANSKNHLEGRKGVNGGFLDPSLPLGVNCYGVKPKPTAAEQQELLPGAPKHDGAFDALVERIKAEMASLRLSPFKSQTWSEWNSSVANAPSKLLSSLAPKTTQSLPNPQDDFPFKPWIENGKKVVDKLFGKS